jgi:diguanylate cyclase
MQEKPTPIEIARQALMQLASRKVPPTPDNFRTVYDEIAGVVSTNETLELAHVLDKVLHDAGKQRPKYIAAAQSIATLIEKKDWAKLEDQLIKLLPLGAAGGDETSWPVVIRNLLKQLEVSHKGVTLTRKKEGLNRVLTNFGSDPDVLPQKIQSLVNSWGQGSVADHVPGDGPQVLEGEAETIGETPTPAPSKSLYGKKPAEYWREMLVRTMELVLIPQLHSLPEPEAKVKQLVKDINTATNETQIQRIAEELKGVLFTLEMHGDQQNRLHEALLQLLRLLNNSMGELVLEDKWLHGQTKIVQDILEKPLDLTRLYDAESSLKEMLYKQGQIKPRLIEAKDSLKRMAEIFVDRLAEMDTDTGEYQNKLNGYRDRISSTEDLVELNSVIDSLLNDTRSIGLSIQRSKDALVDAQQRADEAEKLIDELTRRLDHISEVAHEDYLTGTLNRRGMDEAMEREFARADRHGTPLCIAMMDIDHFKQLNDNLGHATGDQALVHLVRIIKYSLRNTDVLARYGGEEFIIILPSTQQEEAMDIIKRVQRDLTKNFFMHRNERVLITFSAGVAERLPGEGPDTIVPRADAALYKAKHSGRNRVIGAEGLLEEPEIREISDTSATNANGNNGN